MKLPDLYNSFRRKVLRLDIIPKKEDVDRPELLKILISFLGSVLGSDGISVYRLCAILFVVIGILMFFI